ncbi:TPA: UDP-glucose--hexose-1-phosphate uridylyltransferase [Staphylococcus pseudintermedius]|uniref:UDP-glucose--hexose-1-phosphate uridylyltransferase n=1 Tax=Staphylococcus pseudintermedius TaxID=283734 RepID=UPI000E28501D|nr:UDP-glucose--hexose-1-phosphate uridylyltransferase [Staphylococcus pseudintermedius]EGQ0330024.1 UDP-glucose--hexose-1-phosphate uridylyltransferase [Staphylococcus pseudintermedius]EGQ1649739.1 UDP-glucose--hexose-1-phosphate uridylyltransferase [Staphylococcus pseudintermedius]EGQ2802538.1 UDP-glucose--hexose-1-phosphate uridylyltransferase [Staphylococcus pseudintermedius]EGQ3165321.1 UDP-glucose--hexose-1-phosphate uridylyltransferase [Staphylococcus pseudintermedius]EGQ3203762.1 UDP-g
MANAAHVYQFADAIIAYGDYEAGDRIYVVNQILSRLKADDIALLDTEHDIQPQAPIEIVNLLIEDAIERGAFEDILSAREQLEATLMDLITPKPSTVNREFYKRYQLSPKAATDYFYQLSHLNHYIKEEAIAKNIVYHVPTAYGDFEITINLSKPEKDAKQIEREKNAPESFYPKCAICMENEGYYGTMTSAARSNHRIVQMQINGEAWGFQYSPYLYFNEHSILLSREHTPMLINQATFENLLDFVKQFPHYTIGSNADIPVVGGSILSHNHYQAGRHTFPMALAPIERAFELKDFPTVQAGIVKWPMSVIRLMATDTEQLIEASEWIRHQWESYSDASVQVKAYSDSGERHHTVTPIARFRDGRYEMDIVLRDNQRTEEFPDGLFHPHQDVQHIKKENIGLIEVMGTAILPGRLKNELQNVIAFLNGDETVDLGVHTAWAQDMKEEYDFGTDNAEAIVRQEVGYKFERVLQDAGVFKRDEAGQVAFQRFIATLNVKN